ncbi:MAG: hypothetical protein KAS32_31395 [Candidatus Peribacteraceae bacterium]|nr:hypothetical protein [Candidatus Peribacteraceae bacterium]
MERDKERTILVLYAVIVLLFGCMLYLDWSRTQIQEANYAMNISLTVSEQAKEYWLNETYTCWDMEEVYKDNLTVMESRLNDTKAELDTLKHIFSNYCVCDCDNQRIDDFLYGVDKQ